MTLAPNRYYQPFQPKVKRPPLRTSKEMAAEFGVPLKALVSFIHHHDGPKALLRHGSFDTGKSSWYDPAEMRRWWKTLDRAVSATHCTNTQV